MRLIAQSPKLLDACLRALPLLEQMVLDDFIGNGEIDQSRPSALSTRCALIADIKEAIAAIEHEERTSAGIVPLSTNPQIVAWWSVLTDKQKDFVSSWAVVNQPLSNRDTFVEYAYKEMPLSIRPLRLD